MTHRILIVDDDEALRESLELVLVSEGYQVVTAECGATALERLEEQPLDVVLCDVRMPRLDGLGLIQAGIGVALVNGWVVLFVPAAWAGIYWIAIRHEEAYLEGKFGEVYSDYKASVRRWF